MTRPHPRFVPPGHQRLPLPGGGSLLVHQRSLITSGLLLVAGLVVGLATVATGAYDLTPMEALKVLGGSGTELDRFIMVDQRLPRAIAALLVGAALGGAGAIFQSVTRNPLGSPDIIGFTTGAATGGLIVILLTGTSTAATITAGTLIGGVATALIVALLSLGRGSTGDRLVLGGIAVAAVLSAVNDYLLSRATLEEAEAAKAWQYGSLNAITWSPILPLAIVLAISAPAALASSRALRVLELGDDAAAGVGLPLTRTRSITLTIGLCLTAIAVATAGPIGFLALAAPQLAHRVARSPGISIPTSMAMGALILVIADLVAQRVLSPFQIPVGLVTAAVGGGYLVWILVLTPRHRRAAP